MSTTPSRRHIPTSGSTPKLLPASPPSKNPRRPIQHSLTPLSAFEHTETLLLSSFVSQALLPALFASPVLWHRHCCLPSELKGLRHKSHAAHATNCVPSR